MSTRDDDLARILAEHRLLNGTRGPVCAAHDWWADEDSRWLSTDATAQDCHEAHLASVLSRLDSNLRTHVEGLIAKADADQWAWVLTDDLRRAIDLARSRRPADTDTGRGQ